MHEVIPVLDGKLPGMMDRVFWAGTALSGLVCLWRPL
jgi:hypothetical protein